jgi:hypothetical protein
MSEEKIPPTEVPEVPEQDSEIEEFVYEEELSWGEVIHSVFGAFSCIEDIDYAMASEQDKMRIKRIRRKGLKLIDAGISEIYAEKFYTDENTDNTDNEDD